MQFRNPWGANSAAEYKGEELSNTSSGWGVVPRTQVYMCTVKVQVKMLWLFMLHTSRAVYAFVDYLSLLACCMGVMNRA